MKLIIIKIFVSISAVFFALCAPSQAQDYPSKTIRFIVPTGPGIATDILTRHIAQRLGERWGVSTVVENRPGGDQVVAIQALLQSPADGHTIMLNTMSLPIVLVTKKDLPFVYERDLSPLARFATTPVMLVINPSVPASNLAELVAYSKANPGRLSAGGNGRGIIELLFELLKMRTGVDLTYIPYKDSSFYTADLLSGRIQMGMAPPAQWFAHIKDGKVRPLLIVGPARNPSLPSVPTVGEASGDADLAEGASWFGFFVRKGTPRASFEKLEREILAIAQQKDVRDKILENGIIPVSESADVFSKRIESDMKRWSTVVREAKLKFD